MNKIQLHPSFPLLLLTVLMLDKNGLFFLALAAVCAHEAAHILCLWLAGGKIEFIRFTAFGIKIQVAERPVLSYGKELLTLAAGPLANGLGAFCFAYYGNFAGAGVFLLFGVFNLLPIKNLDGGRITHILLLQLLPMEAADMITLCLSVVVLLLLLYFITVPAFFIIYILLILSFLAERPFSAMMQPFCWRK